MTPLPRDPRDLGDPRASSQKLDAAAFDHEFGTVALTIFAENIYVDGFYNEL